MKKIISGLSITTIILLTGCSNGGSKSNTNDIKKANGDIKIAAANTIKASKNNVTMSKTETSQFRISNTVISRTKTQLYSKDDSTIIDFITSAQTTTSVEKYFDNLNTNNKKEIKKTNGDWVAKEIDDKEVDSEINTIINSLFEKNIENCQNKSEILFTCTSESGEEFNFTINDYYVVDIESVDKTYDIKISFSDFNSTKVNMPSYK